MSKKIYIQLGLWAMMMPMGLWAINLAPPELTKVNWESRQLTAIDINQDGRTDLSYIDGIERAINLLVQKKEPTLTPSKATDNTPPMELSRYDKERISTEGAPFAFVWADINAQGAPELVYTAKGLGVVFVQRQADGSWRETHRIADIEPLPYTHTLWAGRLAPGDTHISIVAAVRGRVVVIQDYKVAASYPTLRDQMGYIQVADINADGRNDIIYDYEIPHGAGYRLQDNYGRYDTEMLLNYDTDSEKNFAYHNGKILFFGGNTPFVEQRQLAPDSLKPSIAYYGGWGDRVAATLVDIKGNGQADWIVADSKGSELITYSRATQGWGNPGRWPSLKAVNSLAPIAAGNSLALYSPDEKAIGITSWDAKEKRLIFPRIVEMSDEPVALTGSGGLAWVIMRADKDFFIQTLSSDGLRGTRTKLEGLKRAPDAVLTLRQKDEYLLCIWQKSDPALFYSLSATGAVAPVKVPSTLARANFTSVDLTRVGRGDINSDGREELILAQRGTLRIFQYDSAKRELSLADQVLPLAQEATLRTPLVIAGTLWAYDSRSDDWMKFTRGDDALWRHSGQIPGATMDPEAVTADGNSWIVLGRRAFYTIDPTQPGVTLRAHSRWESNLKIDGYNWGSLESFSPGQLTVILFNQPKRILELVSLADTEGSKTASLMNFVVYQPDDHYSGRKGEEIEPREIIAADVTGDQKPDLILLLHNRILVYPQR